MAAPGVAVPGTVIPSGVLVTPGGPQGIGGIQGPSGPNYVSADAGNIATIGTDNLILVPQSQITSVRLRSFNAVGNPNFEVAQRNTGTALANPASGAFIEDRWVQQKSGTLAYNAQVLVGAETVKVPGTNFYITANLLRITVTTTQASLAAGDYMQLVQNIEGPMLRELLGDVHSLQFLVRSSVAGFKFGFSLTDPSNSKSFTNVGTISAANTWQLLPFANIPVFASGGSWSFAPGAAGYVLRICLGCGTTYTSSANGSWLNGFFIGANGQSNLFATASATFDIAFVQHEPGPNCTTLIDKPFIENLQSCKRYYQKSSTYGVVTPNTGDIYGIGTIMAANNAGVRCFLRFEQEMAKSPTISCWDHNNTGNNVYVDGVGSAVVSGGGGSIGHSTKGFTSLTLTAAVASVLPVSAQWTADTGW